MNPKTQISELANRGGERGLNFTVPVEALAFVGRMAEVYLASTSAGAVRGNHHHLRRGEAIVVLPGARRSFHWTKARIRRAAHREFDGSRAVLVLRSPGASHVVRNDGDADLWLVAISSETYDPAKTGARRVV